MRSAIIDVNENSRFVYGQPLPPVDALISVTGLGKTRAWRERVAAPLVRQGLHPVLAVPRHRLGDAIVADLAEEGIRACEYRGREQADPNAPGQRMCREAERVGLIQEALGAVSNHACKSGDKQCPSFDVCGYQRQRLERPDMWLIPHQLLFYERPDFIPPPAALGIDENFWNASLRGFQPRVKVWLRSLIEQRHVPRDIPGTADLIEISRRVHAMLMQEQSGRIRRAALVEAGITVTDLRHAHGLEWRRKRAIKEVYPGMPIREVREFCEKVAEHNQEVGRLARFWKLLADTLESDSERSPWLELRTDEPVPITMHSTEPAVRMMWREDIHHSWDAPTTVLDATMPEAIVRQFFPDMEKPIRISAPAPHVRVRQIVDRSMSAVMLIPSDKAKPRTNQTRQNNDERVGRFIEVRAREVHPGRVLVICQLGLEIELKKVELPENVEVRHFNDIAGENTWNDVALLMVIGRTEASPEDVEANARTLFGADVAELPPGAWYPLTQRSVLMRDAGVASIESPCHPDPRAEAVRWSICEAGLMQAIGRGRAVNRTAANPLQIDILTNYALPLVVDEFTTWDLIQPADAEVMRAKGAVPLNYRDMAAAYPDLFASDEAARKALGRENPGQMPIEKYLLGVCPGFSAIEYRREGSRGPASTLLFDGCRVGDPVTWLTAKLGEVVINGPVRAGFSIPFKEYLKGRRCTDTRADFVKDVLRDRDFPEARAWDQVESYLHRRVACPEAIAAARLVWREYHAACAG